MRTTLTLDPDVARLIEEEVHRQRRPFKQIINDALRRGLAGQGRRRGTGAYRLPPHHASLRSGLNPAGLNRLADELEHDESVAKLRRSSSK